MKKRKVCSLIVRGKALRSAYGLLFQSVQLFALLHPLIELEAHLPVLLLPGLVGWFRVCHLCVFMALVAQTRLCLDEPVVHCCAGC